MSTVLSERDWAAMSWRATPDAMMADLTDGQLIPPPHLKLLGYLMYLSRRNILPRLTISLPPGHAKTTITRWGCAWALEDKPHTRIAYTSYGTDLAEESGKAVRQILTENAERLAVRLKMDSRASDHWQTTAEGGMWSAGIRAGLTGRRISYGIVDDPHKDWAEATSEYFTSLIWSWYQSVFLTRLVPRSPIAVIMTRWSNHDLVARIQEASQDARMPDAMRWCHVRLAAIAEEEETVDTVLGERTCRRLRQQNVPLPDWHREAGEPLWPVALDPDTGLYGPHYDLEMMTARRIEVGPIVWEGMYQQRPPAEGGRMFKDINWRYIEAAPMEGLKLIRWWDTAATEKKLSGKKRSDPDWTVGVMMGRAPNGLIYVLDVQRFRVEPGELEKRIRLTAINDMQRYGTINQGVSEDPAAAGKITAAYIKREVLHGFNCMTEPESNDKVVRALPYSAQQSNNNVFLVTGPGSLTRRENAAVDDYTFMAQKADWVDEYVKEHTNFDDGAHDDQVDASSMAFIHLSGVTKVRARIIV